jgi:ABC-type glycerol-3-phosphate transport system permease component
MSTERVIFVEKERVLRRSSWVPEALNTLILVLLALVVILPLIIPFFFVFKTRLEFNYNPWALPKAIRWDNFTLAWKGIRLDLGMFNTLEVCAGAIALTVPISAMAGYICARYRSRVTEVVFYIILGGFFIPIQMVLIPLVRMSSTLHIANTLPGVFLPMAAFGVSFWTMIYRSFFKDLPGELADAARIDGAGHTGTFFRIMAPLASPATVLAVILVFIGAWSDYLLSLVMLNSPSLFTMQLRTWQFTGQYGVDHMPRYSAAAIIAAAPTVILYIIGHRWVLKGTLAGALKG